MAERGWMVKGVDVYRVHIEDYSGLNEVPKLLHGVVAGGGEQQVIVQWDHYHRPVRSQRWREEEQNHPSALAAWEHARRRLESIRDSAQERATRADAALYWLGRSLDEELSRTQHSEAEQS